METLIKRPVIGMVPAYDPVKKQCFLRPQYARAIQKAGGLAFILPLTDEAEDIDQITDLYDGFLFTGGADLSPSLYGEKPLPCTRNCVVNREKMELSLMKSILAKNKPVLGICRGMQFINVYFHGTLYQDILDQRKDSLVHWQKEPFETPSHMDQIDPASPLYRVLKTTLLPVNSLHHQGVKECASELRVMAHASDGLVEAIYHPDYPFVWGIQWHPEFLTENPKQLAIFEALIQAADQKRKESC